MLDRLVPPMARSATKPAGRSPRPGPASRPAMARSAATVRQKRIVSTGKHDDVGALAVLFDKARRDLGQHGLPRRRSHRAYRLQPCAPDCRCRRDAHGISTPKDWMRSRVYARLTVPGVASTDTRPERVRSAAGLIAGTVPTKGVCGKGRRAARPSPASRPYCRRSPLSPDQAPRAGLRTNRQSGAAGPLPPTRHRGKPASSAT